MSTAIALRDLFARLREDIPKEFANFLFYYEEFAALESYTQLDENAFNQKHDAFYSEETGQFAANKKIGKTFEAELLTNFRFLSDNTTENPHKTDLIHKPSRTLIEVKFDETAVYDFRRLTKKLEKRFFILDFMKRMEEVCGPGV